MSAFCAAKLHNDNYNSYTHNNHNNLFMDNDLTHITEDHFEIKLIARLLDQMYVVQAPVFPPRYDDALPSAPQFPEHLHSLLTHS